MNNDYNTILAEDKYSLASLGFSNYEIHRDRRIYSTKLNRFMNDLESVPLTDDKGKKRCQSRTRLWNTGFNNALNKLPSDFYTSLGSLGYKDYYFITRDARVYNAHRHTWCATPTRPDGRVIVRLPTEGGSPKNEYIYRLVALSFIPNEAPYIRTEVNHIDGDISNNGVGNLEWVSKIENEKHSATQGSYGSRDYGIGDEVVIEICLDIQLKYTFKQLQDKYPLPWGAIRSIYLGRYRHDISKNYGVVHVPYKKEFISQSDAFMICKYLELGWSTKDILKEFKSGLSPAVVENIKKRRSHIDISKHFKF